MSIAAINSNAATALISLPNITIKFKNKAEDYFAENHGKIFAIPQAIVQKIQKTFKDQTLDCIGVINKVARYVESLEMFAVGDTWFDEMDKVINYLVVIIEDPKVLESHILDGTFNINSTAAKQITSEMIEFSFRDKYAEQIKKLMQIFINAGVPAEALLAKVVAQDCVHNGNPANKTKLIELLKTFV